MRPIVLIAAVARNGVIGSSGHMPWRLPGDLQHFRAATLGRPVIMGRRTFASIGHPLPGRSTIVLTQDPGFVPAGAIVASNIGDAVEKADRAADRLGADTLMVAGGGMIYAAFMPLASRLSITEVDIEPDGDAKFPPIHDREWFVAARIAATPHPEDDAAYSFVTWNRR
ncbi:dihydrofolate reductase [Lichenifustis flavocetrariae]|uniref:Dihydrofolate reductase n=1 Tax=Lichenifustis flavocetrariae TaxID=2949735 RepID=A0AA41YZW5_9HYPH|nr:dihydrofolate reductase [Lichenifustis flavocetrariae]MCW6506747.1 dihydrofolate reductase [Lichenifustis flavocetrariae]